MHRSVFYYKQKVKEGDEYLRRKIREIAGVRPRFGYKRITVMLNRQGIKVGKDRVLRLYREEGLELNKQQKKRRRFSFKRVTPPPATKPGQRWSIDLLSDKLIDKRAFRVLGIVDQYSRRCMGLFISQSFPTSEVIKCLDQVICLANFSILESEKVLNKTDNCLIKGSRPLCVDFVYFLITAEYNLLSKSRDF